MAKLTHRLTDLAIRKARPRQDRNGKPRTTLLPDGGGLYAQLSPGKGESFSISWVFRSAVGGRETRIGLGPYPGVSLAEAREKAEPHRRSAANGTNPRDAKLQKELDDERAAREKAAADALAAGVTIAAHGPRCQPQ